MMSTNHLRSGSFALVKEGGPPLTNKVLVQLWHLNSRTENPQKKVIFGILNVLFKEIKILNLFNV